MKIAFVELVLDRRAELMYQAREIYVDKLHGRS